MSSRWLELALCKYVQFLDRRHAQAIEEGSRTLQRKVGGQVLEWRGERRAFARHPVLEALARGVREGVAADAEAL